MEHRLLSALVAKVAADGGPAVGAAGRRRISMSMSMAIGDVQFSGQGASFANSDLHGRKFNDGEIVTEFRPEKTAPIAARASANRATGARAAR
jgi:hypothetical protein